MQNFTSHVKQPWTTYDNRLVQEKTIFKNANQKLTYMYLVSYANASKIFPSMEAIGEAICSTSRTAMTIIQQLEELGLIEVLRTPGLSNQYILNDYFEVEEQLTRDKLPPVKNFHPCKNFTGTHEKISPPPVKNFHPKKKTIKLKNKNKTSSRESIDSKLKNNYPNKPFEAIKKDLLEDDSITIETDKQYESMLNYRLKNWKPKKEKKSKMNTKQDKLPKWMKKQEENREELRTDKTKDLQDLLSDL